MLSIRYGFCDMKVTNKNVCIGDGVEIAEFVHFWGLMKPVTIGKNVGIGIGTVFLDRRDWRLVKSFIDKLSPSEFMLDIGC